MEAQVENTTSPSAQSIVEQLLEIAKKNDAMDVIGVSTSWRWQEGFISRMPKTKTVAAILTKAFKSDDPRVWIRKTNDELRAYLMNIYSLEEMNKIYAEDFSDKYELLFFFTLSDSRGATKDELIFKLALFKYAEVFSGDVVYFENLDEEAVLSINGDWAELKVDLYIEKFMPLISEEGYYSFGEGHTLTINEECSRFIKELDILRLRIVGYNSHFDMWKYFASALTDREMVYIERKLIKYFDELRMNIQNESIVFDQVEEKTRKTRFFSFSAFSVPNRPGEDLRCNY